MRNLSTQTTRDSTSFKGKILLKIKILVGYYNMLNWLYYTGCIKKTEQILNRSQRREAAQSMKFFINIDCLGTYDVE